MTKFYPLDAPGMPPPGPDFLRMVGASTAAPKKPKKKKGETEPAVVTVPKIDELSELYRRALYSAGSFKFPIALKAGKSTTVSVVTGHLWGKQVATGPEPADVMVIGKMLGEDEVNMERNLIGPSAQLLLRALKDAGATNRTLSKWYVTNILKCEHPNDNEGWAAGWVKDFMPLLHQELRIVRPKHILCLGSDASKALLGKSYTVAKMEGQVIEYKFSTHKHYNEPPEEHTALVMTCLHPASVLRYPEQTEQFEFSLQRFLQLTEGLRWDKAEQGIDHRVISDEDTLAELVQEIINDPEAYQLGPDGQRRLVLAVDAEWHGEHPQNANAYVRTIQLSWKDRRAACIVLRHAGGVEAFEGGIDRAIELLNKLCKSTPKRPVRIVGHFLVADLEWLIPLGLDLRAEFACAEEWHQMEYSGGFDTGIAAHALNETDEFGLKTQALRKTTAPRYDLALQAWIAEWCKTKNLKASELEGYGEAPDTILHPYGNYDADVTRRIWVRQTEELKCDRYGNNCYEAFWNTSRALPAILEMNCTGLMVDRPRLDQLTMTYLAAKQQLLEHIRKKANWPEFNLDSVYHVREYLFGEEYNGKDRKDPNVPIRVRPQGAKTLRLTPVMSTGKRPRLWSEVRRAGDEDEECAATGKQALAILAEESQAVRVYSKKLDKHVTVDYSKSIQSIRDARFISQVCKSVLRKPKATLDEKGKPTEEMEQDEDGLYLYDKGLPGAICDDSRVRTHFYPTMETGRWGSARPPIHNLSKSREPDYKRILGHRYNHPLRSILRAPPGKVLIEADYIGAELFIVAVLANDEQLLDHCLRGQLEESDPNYYDTHSNIAVEAFRLKCEPTKAGLDSIGKKDLRTIAKAVIFGLMYGRGPKAIAVSAKEQGVELTVDEAQMLIDAIFRKYPRLQSFLHSCGVRALRVGWLCNSFGRFRRFPRVPGSEPLLKYYDAIDEGLIGADTPPPRLPGSVRTIIGEIERQAGNSQIQGTVADAVNHAVYHLYHYRDNFRKSELDYSLVMQLHDALLLEAEARFANRIVEEVFPTCMRKMVPIYPCNLDGTPTGRGPYYLGIDVNVYSHWGVPLTKDQCAELGVNPKYSH